MTLTFDTTVTVDGVDISAYVRAGAAIDRGRPSVLTGFTSPSAVFTVHTVDTWPTGTGFPTISEGDPVLIHVTWDGTTQWRRFTGKVQAIDYSALKGLTVTCAGNSVDLDAFTVGDTYPVPPTPVGIPIPSEPDVPTGTATTDRVTRFSDEAVAAGFPYPINIVGSAGRYLTPIPADTAGENYLTALLNMASSCDGLLRETPLGDIDYVARIHTRPARYTLPADIVERDTVDLVRDRGLVRNAVYVYFGGIDPATGEQSRAYSDDAGSITGMGLRTADPIVTQLQFLAGAQGKGAQYILNNAAAWHAPDVTLIMAAATGAQADDILALAEGDPVKVTPLPDGCPIAYLDCDVIGFTEILHQEDYRIILHLAPGGPSGDEDDGNWIVDGDITGGDESGTYVAGGAVWRWHKFNGSGDLTVADGVSVIGRMLLAAGGGGSGANTNLTRGAGGGAGGLIPDDAYLLLPGVFPVVIGTGGLGASGYWVTGVNGTDSTFDGLTAFGGGGGGSVDAPTGLDGGSGGGGVDGSPGGQGVDGQGSDGGPASGGGWSGYGSGAGLDADITGVTTSYAQGSGAGVTDYPMPGNLGWGATSSNIVYGTGITGDDGCLVIAYRISPSTATPVTYDMALDYDTAIAYQEVYL